MQRAVVLMSGYPASGKSTLAAALAERLGFALVSKDLLLMTLYTSFQFPPGEAAWSLRTGAAAWAAFWLQARLSPQVVLDTNIQVANQQQLDDLKSLGGTLIEVRCDCPTELAVRRYAERAGIGHAAQRYTELDQARLAAYAQPIGLGQLITVDTSIAVDADAVAARVRSALGGQGT